MPTRRRLATSRARRGIWNAREARSAVRQVLMVLKQRKLNQGRERNGRIRNDHAYRACFRDDHYQLVCIEVSFHRDEIDARSRVAWQVSEC